MSTSATPPQIIIRHQEVRALPGQLDQVPVFNSNSPELVLQEGILLSTFPPQGKDFPEAHLNFPLQGRFDIFAHHIAKATTQEDLRTLYLGIILQNPGNEQIKVEILQAASYLSQPDAPFIELPSQADNHSGKVYSGPGSRVMGDILRGRRQADFPRQLVIEPRQSSLLFNLPIPVRKLSPPLNGRSSLIRLHSDGEVYAASLALYALLDADGNERTPTREEWVQLLEKGQLAQPRERTPSPPEVQTGQFIYGRVAGVAQGSLWQARLTDQPQTQTLSIPQPGQAFSYALSTIKGGSLGTGQIQSAPMLVRYSDTAYFAHGNYGVQYSLTLPLVNGTGATQTVTLALETPLKQEQLQRGLRFLSPPDQSVFFRGTVQVCYQDDTGIDRIDYLHLVQRRGQIGEALVSLKMLPLDQRLVKVDFLYPADATPPQVLTVKTLELAA